jgi:predicted transcriptional regulator
MSALKREAIFQIRISDEERRMLQVIADEDGLTSSDVVRQSIRREWLRRYQPEMPKPKKLKK